ncbi:MAG: hypothetical protein GY820_35475 [Gammaproteobacteria bacterium]|nr:hypothetical protein [Gammaproteobacteria bacterium]
MAAGIEGLTLPTRDGAPKCSQDAHHRKIADVKKALRVRALALLSGRLKPGDRFCYHTQTILIWDAGVKDWQQGG